MPRAKRSLSQNFLIDPNLQRKVVAELEADPDDVVLEVGPGHGELTSHLVGRVARLVLIEKDRDLTAELRDRWDDPAVRIVEADALEEDLSAHRVPGRDLRVISNVPYSITSPLLFTFLAIQPPARRLVLTVQKEVAERVVAAPGSRTYGALSVGVQAVATAGIAFDIGRRAFRPVPDVDSAVLRIDPDPERVGTVDPERLRRVTRAFFGRRRKQVQKILRTAPELGLQDRGMELLERLGLDPRARPERLAPPDFLAIARALPRGEG